MRVRVRVRGTESESEQLRVRVRVRVRVKGTALAPSTLLGRANAMESRTFIVESCDFMWSHVESRDFVA